MRKIKCILAAAFLAAAFTPAVFAFDFDDDNDSGGNDGKKVSFFNIGADLFNFEETSKGRVEQKDKGFYQGAFIRFTTYRPFGWLNDNSDKNFFTFEARYAQSRAVKRSGGYTLFGGPIPVYDMCAGNSCPPVDAFTAYSPDYFDPSAKRSQWIAEFRGLGGQKLLDFETWNLEGSLGLGFRMHKDNTGAPDPVFITIGKMSDSYLYLPLGLSSQIKNGGVKLKINGEFDWVFIATKKTGSKYAFVENDSFNIGSTTVRGPSIVESSGNDYTSHGLGWRLSADLETKAGPVAIVISPYYRFWAINEYRAKRLTNGYSYWVDSTGQDNQSYFPKTVTKEYGVQASVMF